MENNKSDSSMIAILVLFVTVGIFVCKPPRNKASDLPPGYFYSDNCGVDSVRRAYSKEQVVFGRINHQSEEFRALVDYEFDHCLWGK